MRGFTLVELVVVISIMSILFVAGVVNFGTLRENQNLTSATFDLQSLIRLAQSNATSGVQCGSSPAFDWRITILGATDIILSCLWDHDNNPTTAPVSSEIKRQVLSSNIKIEQLFGNAQTCQAGVNSSITFGVPFGRATFSDPLNQACIRDSDSFNMVVKNQNDAQRQMITIRKGGAINIESSQATLPSPPPSPIPPYGTPVYTYPTPVNQGSAGSTTINSTLSAGTSQVVSFSVSSILPSAALAVFSPTSCSPTCSSNLNISTATTTPAGTYPVDVTGQPLSKTT